MANIYEVLDVSYFNTINNYGQVAEQVDGVLIRVGYRGYGSAGTLVKDTMFETHYAGFKDKTKIGVYFFTQATSDAEAVAEADYVYNIIKDRQIDFPVYVDSEYSNNNHNGRADNLSATNRTNYIIAFCERMIELGYRAGVYASDSWFVNQLSYNVLQTKDYSRWVASYSYAPKKVTTYDGWQYTSSAELDGAPSRVDLSHFYTDVAGWENSVKRDIADATVTLNLTTVTFYGDINCPTPEVIYNGTVLTNGQQYWVSWENNINAGIGDCIIHGQGGMYTGEKTVHFTIEPRDINSAVRREIEHSDEDNCFDISTLKLIFEDKYDTELIEGTDYTKTVTIGESNGYKVAHIVISGIGNFTGTTNLSYNTEKIKISIVPFTGTVNYEYFYTGTKIEPGIVLKDTSNNTLSPLTDYTLTYTNNLVVGEATITVTGKGNYIGTKTMHFEIKPRTLNDCTISCGSPNVDTGIYDLNNITVKFGNITLIKGTDYDTSVTTKTENNRVTSTVTATGKGNFTSTVQGSYLTEIIDTRTDITTLSFSLKQTSYTYDGTAKTPEVNIPDGLEEGFDYRITYKDNKNAGTASVEIQGLNNYKGTKVLNFTIDAIDITPAIVSCGEPDEQGNYDISNLTVSLNNKILIRGTEYSTTVTTIEVERFYYSNVVITGINNHKGTITKQYKLGKIPPNPKTIDQLTITGIPGSYDYDGSPKVPSPVLYDEDERYTLIEGTDYRVDYEDNVGYGVAKVIITGLTTTYHGTKEITFIINRVSISSGSLSCGEAYEGGFYDLDNITLSVNSRILRLNTDYKITTEDVEEGLYNLVKVTATGMNNYFGTITNSFRISKISKDIAQANIRLEFEEYDFTGSTITPKIITTLEEGKDFIVERPENSILHGYYSINIFGINRYENTYTVLNYIIRPFSLTDSSISVTFDEPDVLGLQSVASMKVTRKIGSETITLGSYSDYKISVEETLEGEGFIRSNITITGINNYRDSITASVLSTKKDYYNGKRLELYRIKVYVRYSSFTHTTRKTGTYYIWDDNIVNGRVRITNDPLAIGIPGYLTGWIDVEDLIDRNSIRVNDVVRVNGNLNVNADGSGNQISRKGINMVVVDVLDKEKFSHPYGLATDYNRARIGWAKEEDIEKQNIDEEDKEFVERY